MATPEHKTSVLAAAGKDTRLNYFDDTNFSTPLDLVPHLETPNDLFFVRTRHTFPSITADTWRLQVDGLVDAPRVFSLADLQQLPTRTLNVWLECAGNSRRRFDRETEGEPWDHGAVGDAEWTGTTLRHVLELVQPQATAIEVVTYGGDTDKFSRGMPLAKAWDADVMLVWAMNGQPIPTANGGPVRLLTPAWAGIASVKWPKRMEFIDYEYGGYYNKERYIIVNEQNELVRPVREMPVKSVIVNPKDGAVLTAGIQTIYGFAWSGWGGIAQVDLSLDGGATWHAAQLVGQAGRSWTRFEIDWHAKAGQTYQIASRATDEQGNVQPAITPWNKFGYQMNMIDRVTVSVA